MSKRFVQAGRIVAVDLCMLVWVVVFAPIYFFVGRFTAAWCWPRLGSSCPRRCSFCIEATGRACVGMHCAARLVDVCGNDLLDGRLAGPSPCADLVRVAADLRGVYVRTALGTLWTVASVAAVTAFAVVDNCGGKTPNELTAGVTACCNTCR